MPLRSRSSVLISAGQFHVMTFAKPAFGECSREIEVRLAAQSRKLCHMGFRDQIKRSTGVLCDQTIALNGFYSQKH